MNALPQQSIEVASDPILVCMLAFAARHKTLMPVEPGVSKEAYRIELDSDPAAGTATVTVDLGLLLHFATTFYTLTRNEVRTDDGRLVALQLKIERRGNPSGLVLSNGASPLGPPDPLKGEQLKALLG